MAHIFVQSEETRRSLVLCLIFVIDPRTRSSGFIGLHEAVARAADEDEVLGHEIEVLGAVPVVQSFLLTGRGGDSDGDDAGSFAGAAGPFGGFVGLD